VHRGAGVCGPNEIGDANSGPSEESAVRDYVRCVGNCPVETKCDIILQM